jgi:phosphoribosyl 1,2-cyclic phosphodiesterase
MLAAITQADLLILEANHDRERLVRGPYPYVLKQRILGATGHLSNDQTAEALLRTWRADSVRWLWLAHLSRTNNTPTLALQGVREYLRSAGANPAQLHIFALPPDMGPVWDSTRLWEANELWEMQR